jgi:hypothetical protein
MDIGKLKELITEALVREIARRVLRKLQYGQRHALVMYSGGILGFETVLDNLKQLKEQGFSFQILLSEQANLMLDKPRIMKELSPIGMEVARAEMVQDMIPDMVPKTIKTPFDVLLVPALTMRSAAVLAGMTADTPLTRIIQEAMNQHKKIIACTDGCCPDSWFNNGLDVLPVLAGRMRENLSKLQDYGIHLTKSADFSRETLRQLEITTVPREIESEVGHTQSAAKIISAADVAGYPIGSTLHVEKGCQITQLAKDTARTRKISIELER